MNTPRKSLKSARLEARVSVTQKELIERAAAYSGRSVSDFVIAHVEQAAKQAIEEHERIKLDRHQSQALVDALLDPKKPNQNLKRAVQSFRKRVKSR
jgi:uncharacterized protein (DUF1778 family)